MGTHRSQYWKSVPHFAKSGISQAPSLHFSFTRHEQVLLQRGWENATQNIRCITLHMVRYLLSNIQKRPGIERCIIAKPALASNSMVIKCFKCMLLHHLWEETTAEKTTYCQSLHLAGNWTINNINPIASLPVHYWSIFTGSNFERVGGYHCLYKLLDKVGLLVKTVQMFMKQWDDDNAQHEKTKTCFCLQTSDWIHLPKQLSCFFDQERNKGAWRKMGNFLPSRWMFNTQRDSPFSQRTTDGMQMMHALMAS